MPKAVRLSRPDSLASEATQTDLGARAARERQQGSGGSGLDGPFDFSGWQGVKVGLSVGGRAIPLARKIGPADQF